MQRSATLLLAMILGCTTQSAGGSIRDREWTLASIAGAEVSGLQRIPTVRFGPDDRIEGNTGCNSMSGPYSLESDRLVIGALATTKRACVDPRANALERQYLQALGAARRYRLAGEELELLDEAGSIVVRFR